MVPSPSAALAADQPPAGQSLVTHCTGRALPITSAPRPYLHPIMSLAGTTVTDAEPADHPHHLGLSLAFSDVNGTNFWGGSTFTRGGGPVLLPNHGTQVPWGWQHTAGGAAGNVTWRSESGKEVALERRSFHYLSHPDPKTWSLSVASVMVPGAGVKELVVSSSAVKGRNGAGYGGIFWRFGACAGEPVILSAAGHGESAAHGSTSSWLSISMRIDGAPVGVVLSQDVLEPRIHARDGEGLLPWFVRADGYLGAGPAVAWAEPARATSSRPLRLALNAVIHDGPVETSAHALDLLQQHPRISHTRTPDRTP
ncbi:PmoA family protein [Arthrobacter sp. D1-29]